MTLFAKEIRCVISVETCYIICLRVVLIEEAIKFLEAKVIVDKVLREDIFLHLGTGPNIKNNQRRVEQ